LSLVPNRDVKARVGELSRQLVLYRRLRPWLKVHVCTAGPGVSAPVRRCQDYSAGANAPCRKL